MRLANGDVCSEESRETCRKTMPRLPVITSIKFIHQQDGIKTTAVIAAFIPSNNIHPSPAIPKDRHYLHIRSSNNKNTVQLQKSGKKQSKRMKTKKSEIFISRICESKISANTSFSAKNAVRFLNSIFSFFSTLDPILYLAKNKLCSKNTAVVPLKNKTLFRFIKNSLNQEGQFS